MVNKIEKKHKTMMHSNDEKINQFLAGLQNADEVLFETLNACRQLIFEIHPATTEKMMYGGIIFSLESEMYAGVFAYKKHVSMEFGNGYLMQDDANRLEGKGKFRRHIKMENIADIKTKQLDYYIKQAT